MENREVNVLVVQGVPFPKPSTSCFDYVERVLQESIEKHKQVDLVVFPEHFFDWKMSMKNEFEDEKGFLVDIGDRLKKFNCYVVLGSIMEECANGLYNTSFVLSRSGKVFFKHRKKREAQYDDGDDDGVFQTDFGTVALLICLEVEHKDLLQACIRHKKEKEPFFIVNPAWIPSGVKVDEKINKVARLSLDERFAKFCNDNEVYFVRADVPIESVAYSCHNVKEYGCGTSVLISPYHTVFAPLISECFAMFVVNVKQNLQNALSLRKPYTERTLSKDNVGIRYCVWNIFLCRAKGEIIKQVLPLDQRLILLVCQSQERAFHLKVVDTIIQRKIFEFEPLEFSQGVFDIFPSDQHLHFVTVNHIVEKKLFMRQWSVKKRKCVEIREISSRATCCFGKYIFLEDGEVVSFLDETENEIEPSFKRIDVPVRKAFSFNGMMISVSNYSVQFWSLSNFIQIKRMEFSKKILFARPAIDLLCFILEGSDKLNYLSLTSKVVLNTFDDLSVFKRPIFKVFKLEGKFLIVEEGSRGMKLCGAGSLVKVLHSWLLHNDSCNSCIGVVWKGNSFFSFSRRELKMVKFQRNRISLKTMSKLFA